MARLFVRTSLIGFLGLLSCRSGSATQPSDGGGATPTETTTQHASASAVPDVCSVISVDDVAGNYHLPITKSHGLTNGARCDYTSAHGLEVFISVIIWHGVHTANGAKQEASVYLDMMRRGQGMGHVFGAIHPLAGLGDEAVWFAYALALTPGHEPTAPSNVEVVVRRGDSIVSVIRPLPEAEAKSETLQEQTANHAKMVLAKLVGMLGT